MTLDPAQIDWLAGALAGFIFGLSVALAAVDWQDRRELRRIRETLRK